MRKTRAVLVGGCGPSSGQRSMRSMSVHTSLQTSVLGPAKRVLAETTGSLMVLVESLADKSSLHSRMRSSSPELESITTTQNKRWPRCSGSLAVVLIL
jgi:hypothetical protein